MWSQHRAVEVVTAFQRVLTARSREQGKSQRNQGSHSEGVAEGWKRTQELLPGDAGLMKAGGMEQSLLLTARFGWEVDNK